MKNCFFCDNPHCPNSGIDGCWSDDCECYPRELVPRDIANEDEQEELF